MVFSSTIFLFLFLPITLLIYYILGKKLKNLWILTVSIVFFAWSQPRYLWVILLSIIINYFGALLVSKSKKTFNSKFFLFTTVLLNIGLLYYFKYFNFTIDVINQIFNSSIEFKNIILPIGISFFTFQSLSYVVDVYRKQVEVQKNIFKLALYIVLFPQLIAGPIVRYSEVAKEIDSRKTTLDDFSIGIRRFIIGLFKKVIIANSLASIVDSIWALEMNQLSIFLAWLGIIAYSFQIFFDFSGYSDMAIGLGRMFGFHFNENFNLPYISKNITEFWRRWHISLSSWFRDYVYIPLGGNRKRLYLNLSIVFILTGIWHGAAYNFIFWGIWHGIFILIERVLKTKNIKIKLPKVFSHIYTLLVVIIGWVFFRASSIKNAFGYLMVMFGITATKTPGFNIFWYLDLWIIFVLLLAIILSTSIPKNIYIKIKNKINPNLLLLIQNISLILLFGFTILRIVSNTYNPFIYFQF